ncbi:M16 family metallopeptidase [Ferruginibacter sp. SUN106]|uniref:M16 family metallopeptidase n=1 Tax=Ferruginibacter sp. SUN106 TaxID=2978348 RepID=UPI003D3688B6
MKTIILKYCSILLLLITTTGYAQNNTVEFTAGGLKVILRQTQKETLVMNMYFRGGTSNYSPANAGIESLALSGLVECGTTKYPANDFNDQTDEYGLHLAGIADNDYGVVKLSCISKYTDEAWKLFSSAISSPAFETQKFNLLKEQKINDLKGEQSNPDARLKSFAQEFAFFGTSYAINPSGTVAGLQLLNRDAVKDYYYNTLLNKNRMFLVVAGNISREDLEKKILEAFTTIPAKTYTPASIENAAFTQELYKIESRSLATNYIAGIINAPCLNDPNYPAFRLAVTLLNSAMFDYIRLNKQLSYAPSASISEGRISYVTLYASTAQPEETVKAMRLILSYMKGRNYSEKIIENVRKSHLHSYAKRQEIMSEIADQLGKAEIMGDWKLAENLATRMTTVDAEELRRVFNMYAKNVNWAYIGAPEPGKESFK